ncbi:choice-of-anchor Q domain-containing protein [uncultured Kordia sp.]|uniref:InlB B-repeat-containing protein n=1 Tax=uncultured Kordia sp. TaxID=507699 RepID=UPI0026020C62|nr:choice-of-anchor Q domain-containing protein [uncultured Kordia sp.]
MNSRLLSVFLLFCSIAFGQIPTNGLQRAYDFTNGSLADAANGANFTQNGANLVVDSDRFGTSSNSIQPNGDFLNSATFSFTDITIAFWIKTSVIDSNERTIFDKSERTTANFSSANDFKNGFFIYLKDGRIGFKSSRRVVANNNTQAQGNFLGDRFFSEFVADGTWKHIVITIKKEPTQFNTSSGRNTYPYTYNYYVDDELSQTSTENVNVGGIFTGRDLDRPVDLKIANISNGMLSATQTYHDNIDDIYIYNRVLTAAEVSQITTDNNYTVCITPDIADFSTSNITENTATLVLPQTDTFDISYGLSSQPFNTYTIVTDVNGSVFINNLDFSSEYTVRYRKKCAGNTTYNPASGWSLPATFRTKGPLFVNGNATGLNDGSSWTNAYTSLQDALATVNAGEEIWVASGTYKASTTDRTQSFTVNNDDVKLYGGFAGTETSLSQRDIANNETILSGDILSNDNSVIEFTESTRSDNTQHIIRLNAHNTTIDGFTISDGHTMGASDESGAAIYITVLNPLGFNVNNCIIKNNIADNGAFFRFSSLGAYSSGTRNVNVTNTVVENNLSRIGTIYLRDANAEDTNVTLYNCLFKDNVVKDRTGGPAGFAGSVVWAVSNSVPARLTIALNVINCTAVNNQDLGTNGGLNNFTRSPIVFGENGSTMITDIANTIVWNNTTTGGNTSRAVSVGNNPNTGTVLISDSISNDDFANIASGSKVNTSNADPLFTSTTDFTLQTTSPAKDFGDNSKLPTPLNVDLAGNSRIFNVAVDMGAYEFGATTFRPILNILATDGSVTTNPSPTNGAYDFLETISLTAIADPGFEFTGWSGALSGNAANEQLLMDSSKALTATFAPIQRTLTINSTGGTFTTNPNPVNGTYDNGTVVTITITPNAGFMFDSWSGDATGNANPLTITMDGDKVITANYLKNIVYVDIDATGANDGTSWTDAYTSLQNALDNNPISDFWIKAGTYVPGTTRGAIFTLMADQSLYGGFNGTETMLSQRDPVMNVTILSGDILGNDDGVLTHGNTTYSENSYRILQILEDNALVDGLTLSGGNANNTGDTSLKFGAAVRIIESCKSATFNNVIFTDNRVENAGVVYYQHTTSQTGNYDYAFTNCTFKNNLGRFATLLYSVNPRTSGTLTVSLTNCSLTDNIVANASSSLTARNSLVWFRTDVATTHNAIVTNCTIANNSLNGTSTSLVGVVSASRVGGTCNLEINNTIFWDNKLPNGNEQTSVRRWETQTTPNTVTIRNSLAPDGFSNWTTISNIQTTNPMFVDSSAENYTLMMGSAAIDTGDNAFFPSSILEDINGNTRIVGGTIDMGAYEYDATLNTEEVTFAPIDFTIYPNPAKATLNIQTTETIETVSIFDMTGKQILKTNQTTIDVRKLQSGMYIIQVISNQKNSTKRFIKQ